MAAVYNCTLISIRWHKYKRSSVYNWTLISIRWQKNKRNLIKTYSLLLAFSIMVIISISSFKLTTIKACRSKFQFSSNIKSSYKIMQSILYEKTNFIVQAQMSWTKQHPYNLLETSGEKLKLITFSLLSSNHSGIRFAHKNTKLLTVLPTLLLK